MRIIAHGVLSQEDIAFNNMIILTAFSVVTHLFQYTEPDDMSIWFSHAS